MSRLRPTLKTSHQPGLDYGDTYFRVFQATARARKLIHGQLHDNGNSCAIGCYFRQSDIPVSHRAIEEIAAYNDSFPFLSPHERWKKVRTWLRFKVLLLMKTNTNAVKA